MLHVLRTSLVLGSVLLLAGSAPVHGGVRSHELVIQFSHLVASQADGIPVVPFGPVGQRPGSGEGTRRVFVPGLGLTNPDGSFSAPSPAAAPAAATARTAVSSDLREQLLSQMEHREAKDPKLGPFAPAHLAVTEIADVGADLRDRDAVIRVSRFLDSAMSAIESTKVAPQDAQKAVDQFLQEVTSFRTVATAGALRLANQWLSARTFGLIQLQGAEPGALPQAMAPAKQQLFNQVQQALTVIGQEAADAEAQAATPSAKQQSAAPAPKATAAPQADLEKATKALQDARQAAYNAQVEEAGKARAAAEKASAEYAASIRRLNEANRKAAQIQRGFRP